MTVRQQIIESKTHAVATELGVDHSVAFLRLAHSIVSDRSIHLFDEGDLTEGGQDKQIDAFTIDEEEDGATLCILQTKFTESFSSNAVIQLKNGLDWIFNRKKSELDSLKNVALRDRIHDFRSLQGNIGSANIRIIVAYATNGITDEIADEVLQEITGLKNDIDSGLYYSFDFKLWGADELTEELTRLEKKKKKIDAKMKIRFDVNTPSYIRYETEGLKGFICTVAASEVARIVNDDKDDFIFDSNIRRFLGTKRAINKQILNTCTNNLESHLLWFLNNGITLVCDHADVTADPDHPEIIFKNVQIVNGCQTSKVFALAASEGKLTGDARILLRVYETDDPSLAEKIVRTTNTQNKISSRDLKSNDAIQIDLENAFRDRGYWYERKVFQYKETDGVQIERILPNEFVGQSYLAIALRHPSDARRRKYKIWGDDYDAIFQGGLVEALLLSSLICNAVRKHIQKTGLNFSPDYLTRKLAKNGLFHIARVASSKWRGEKWNNQVELKSQIAKLESDPSCLDSLTDNAFETLRDIINNNKNYSSDIESSLRSTSIQSNIDNICFSKTPSESN